MLPTFAGYLRPSFLLTFWSAWLNLDSAAWLDIRYAQPISFHEQPSMRRQSTSRITVSHCIRNSSKKIFLSSALLGSRDISERKPWSSAAFANLDCRFWALFSRRRNARKRYDSRSRIDPSPIFFALRV